MGERPANSISWLPFVIVPSVVLVALGWLLLVFGGSKAGVTVLPSVTGSTVEYFVAGVGEWNPEALRGDWIPWPAKEPIVSNRGETLWIRVLLRNPSLNTWHGILENDDFFADRVDAWVMEKEGGGIHLLAGEGVPNASKSVPGRDVVFPVTVEAGKERLVYLRLDNFFGAYASPVWWPMSADFYASRTRGLLAEGIYLGGLLALLGYNTLLWLRLRQSDLGYYVLYLGAAAAFIFLARALLLELGCSIGSPGLETALTVVMALNGLFLTQFARHFLELKLHLPGVDRFLRGWATALTVLACATLSTPWLPGIRWLAVITIFLGITHAGLLVLVLVAVRRGIRQARFFLLAFGCLFAGTLPLVAVWLWASPLRDLTMRGLMIGSALEMLLLSLAVADRFARAQKQLLEETEHRQMIEAAYADELEQEVLERTRELQVANAGKDRMLAVIGHDLRGPLAGLMRSAENPPAAGLAQDVLQTGRALLLMIEDLVLWARLGGNKRITALHSPSVLLAPAVALHRSLANYGGVELVLELPEKDVRVATDLVLVQTLVRNLVANGLKFARTRVVLRAEETNGGVRIIVGNDGPPLSPEVLARITADQDEPVTATGGMGLRLCREICRALGLSLSATSGMGSQTEFSFILPRGGES